MNTTSYVAKALQTEHIQVGAEVRNAFYIAAIPAVLLFMFKAGSLILALTEYWDFFRQHTDFYKNAPKRKNRTLFLRFPVPWPSERTYYLLDHGVMRKLFASTPSLDAFALARRLHQSVWEVPAKPYKETFREGAKQIHKELSTRNLGAVTKTFEEVITASITKLKEDIGPSGRMVPLHQTWFRIAYRGNMKAIFGPDLPVDETRVAVQTFASCIQALNTAPSLPILPYRWWNKLIPSARRGVKARSDLVDTLVKWQKEGGIESASSTWQNIMKVITDKNVPFDDATRWVNMVMFGFQGNTPEQPGWFFLHVLQSPKLFEAIKAEVANLPEGSLAGTNFKRTTPLLHSAIHETLRMCTATFAGRQATETMKIPGCDQTFPKGVLIRTMTRATTFDSSVWGADPDYYKGDRFMLNENLYREELFFGGGVSACPGRFFAQAELELLMAHLIRAFDFDTTAIEMHKRLPPDTKDLALGPCEKPLAACDIMDIDGSRVKGVYPGIADIEYCIESVSGSLFPIQELVCHLSPR